MTEDKSETPEKKKVELDIQPLPHKPTKPSISKQARQAEDKKISEGKLVRIDSNTVVTQAELMRGIYAHSQELVQKYGTSPLDVLMQIMTMKMEEGNYSGAAAVAMQAAPYFHATYQSVSVESISKTLNLSANLGDSQGPAGRATKEQRDAALKALLQADE
jgi:hypothetical protein